MPAWRSPSSSCSAIVSSLGVSVVHPGTGKTIEAVNLLSIPGLHRILTNLVANFTGFAPLGTVLVAMLGIAVAAGTGLLGAALKLPVVSAPRRVLTVAVVFAGHVRVHVRPDGRRARS